jgi:hypothetical protein
MSLGEANADIYADDTTLWSSSKSCAEIQQTLQNALDITEQWLTVNNMVSNTTKTKRLLIETVQKLRHSDKDELDLYLNGTKLGEIKNEKLLGIKLDKHLKWNKHIEYLIRKLNSRICLLKRAKEHLTIHCRKLLYNAIIKPILEYCCTVWGNCSKEQLIRLLKIQKRCARLILNANFCDNSVKLFTELGWLPISDTINCRKLYMLHKISLGYCPDYFSEYIRYLKDSHNYNTRASTNRNSVIPTYKKVSGSRMFQTSAIRLWNVHC